MTIEYEGQGRLPSKWRPSLGLVLILILGTVLALPLAGLFVFRIYDNQLVRQTEGELVVQAAVLSALVQSEIESGSPADIPLGAAAEEDVPAPPGPYRPILPSLDLATTTPLPPRPDALAAAQAADPAFQALGNRLMPVLRDTQRVTLAGFRLLDPRGVVIAGRDEIGQSLAHIDEVGEALNGRFADVLRLRVSRHVPPPLGSISRGTAVRVFVAMPIIVRHRVAGVIYASRTPDDIVSGLYSLRRPLGFAAVLVFALTVSIGYVLYRTISVPVRDLIGLAEAIGAGDREALRMPRQHGTIEFAALSQSFHAMAARLTERSDAVSTFAAHVTHELKSPLTAIRGAAELLRDDAETSGPTMSEEARRRFLDHILADTTRLGALLRRLRQMAQAEEAPSVGATALRPVIEILRRSASALDIEASGDLDDALRLSAETVSIVVSHLVDNAIRHGATRLDVAARREGAMMRVTLRDDGEGISPSNRARIFDPFFTTRREDGGTGMGLAIVRAMLGTYGGSIALLDTPAGAGFVMTMPVATPPTGSADPSPRRSRLVWLSLVMGVIAAGLALRHIGPGLGLPFEVTKYGGSALWGAMVFGLVALARPQAGRSLILGVSLAVSVLVELSRLIHGPALDAFRLSTAGALLVGRVFSPWDILAYVIGILLAVGADALIASRHRPKGFSAADP